MEFIVEVVAEHQRPVLEKFKSEGARNTVDVMMRPEPVGNQINNQVIKIKETADKNISKIDNVLANLDDEDDNNPAELNLTGIDPVALDELDLDITGINMIESM